MQPNLVPRLQDRLELASISSTTHQGAPHMDSLSSTVSSGWRLRFNSYQERRAQTKTHIPKAPPLSFQHSEKSNSDVLGHITYRLDLWMVGLRLSTNLDP